MGLFSKSDKKKKKEAPKRISVNSDEGDKAVSETSIKGETISKTSAVVEEAASAMSDAKENAKNESSAKVPVSEPGTGSKPKTATSTPKPVNEKKTKKEGLINPWKESVPKKTPEALNSTLKENAKEPVGEKTTTKDSKKKINKNSSSISSSTGVNTTSSTSKKAEEDPFATNENEEDFFSAVEAEVNEVDDEVENEEKELSALNNKSSEKLVGEKVVPKKPLGNPSANKVESINAKEQVVTENDIKREKDSQDEFLKNNTSSFVEKAKESINSDVEDQIKLEEAQEAALEETRKVLASIEASPEKSVHDILNELSNDKDKDLPRKVAEIAALRLSAEDKYVGARTEYERAVTLRKLNQSYQETIQAQSDETEVLLNQLEVEKKLLEEQKEQVKNLKEEARVLREKLIIDSTAAEQARITQTELRNNARNENREAEEKRVLANSVLDKATVSLKESELKLQEVKKEKEAIKEKEHAVKKLESKINGLYDSAEKSREESLALNKDIRRVQKNLRDTQSRTKRYLDFVKEERRKVVEERDKSREIRLEAEKMLVDMKRESSANEAEALMLEDFEKRLKLEESEMRVLLERSREEKHEAISKLEKFKEEVTEMEKKLIDAETSKKSLHSELNKLEQKLLLVDNQSDEIETLKKANGLLEEQIKHSEDLLSMKDSENYAEKDNDQEKAISIIKSLVNKTENTPGLNESEKAGEVQQALEVLFEISSGNKGIVSLLENKVNELLDEISHEKPRESAEIDSASPSDNESIVEAPRDPEEAPSIFSSTSSIETEQEESIFTSPSEPSVDDSSVESNVFNIGPAVESADETNFDTMIEEAIDQEDNSSESNPFSALD